MEMPGTLRRMVDAITKMFDPLSNTNRVSETFPAALDQAQDAYKNEGVAFNIRSDKDTHFTGAIAQNAFEDENLTGLGQSKIRIKGVIIESDQNLDWEVQVYSTDTFEDVDLDLDSNNGPIYLDSLLAKQLAGANQYYYYMPVNIEYEDLDGTFELHVKLVNRSAVAKIAGATGEVVTSFMWEPLS